MAFRPPAFNIWVKVVSDGGTERGWTLCQLRGPTNSLWAWRPGVDPIPQNLVYWEVLMPKGADVRGPYNDASTLGDKLLLMGVGSMTYRVIWVGDKAAGFTNEYRLIYCFWEPDPPGDQPLLTVNSAFVPPGGYTPLPINGPAA